MVLLWTLAVAHVWSKSTSDAAASRAGFQKVD